MDYREYIKRKKELQAQGLLPSEYEQEIKKLVSELEATNDTKR